MLVKMKFFRWGGKILIVEFEWFFVVWVDVGFLDGSIEFGLEKIVNFYLSIVVV